MLDQGPLAVVVLISGSGSNLQAMIDAQNRGAPFRIVAVISNRADAFGLERARRHGIPAEVLNHDGYPDRATYDADLRQLIDAYAPGLVLLAGFMRILTPEFVAHYQGRMLNIHPSLLPKFRGLQTHRRALEAGETEHGASVHFVTAELDGGPLVIQAKIAIQPGEDAEALAKRVLEYEHIIYPMAVDWFAQGRLELKVDGTPCLDGERLLSPYLIEAQAPEIGATD